MLLEDLDGSPPKDTWRGQHNWRVRMIYFVILEQLLDGVQVRKLAQVYGVSSNQIAIAVVAINHEVRLKLMTYRRSARRMQRTYAGVLAHPFVKEIAERWRHVLELRRGLADLEEPAKLTKGLVPKL